jgi:catechol 2,3-dioxygenase-like lactoylglutathione lyase family enzyme
MAARIAEKSLRHVSLCVSDLAQAKAFYGDVLGLEELPRPDLGIPGAWLSVGGDLQLHLLENPERASAGADHRLSIADPHFALWINDVPSMVEELALLQPSTGGPPVALANARLASSVQYDEAWLQQLLFDHPELLPLDVVDPGAGFFIAVCRELAMPKPRGSVSLGPVRGPPRPGGRCLSSASCGAIPKPAARSLASFSIALPCPRGGATLA